MNLTLLLVSQEITRADNADKHKSIKAVMNKREHSVWGGTFLPELWKDNGQGCLPRYHHAWWKRQAEHWDVLLWGVKYKWEAIICISLETSHPDCCLWGCAEPMPAWEDQEQKQLFQEESYVAVQGAVSGCVGCVLLGHWACIWSQEATVWCPVLESRGKLLLAVVGLHTEPRVSWHALKVTRPPSMVQKDHF